MQVLERVPQCAMCHAGNVAMQTILLSHVPKVFSYWFECRVCGYSSPGRTSQVAAMDDVRWVTIDKLAGTAPDSPPAA